MFRALFSLDGRLDRRAYLLWSLAGLALVMVAVLAVAAAALLIIRADLFDELTPIAPAVALFAKFWPIVVLAVFLWTSMAVAAKRIRDIGLSPVPVVCGVFGLAAALKLFGAGLGLVAVSLLAAVLWYGFPTFLLLWPGRARPRQELADTFS